jgi:hypothetical protein
MEKINKLALFKGAVEFAISAGVGIIVGNLVKATTPPDIGRFQKIVVAIGSYGLTVVLGDISAKHISEQIDSYAEKVNNLLNPSDEKDNLDPDEEYKIDPEEGQIKHPPIDHTEN